MPLAPEPARRGAPARRGGPILCYVTDRRGLACRGGPEVVEASSGARPDEPVSELALTESGPLSSIQELILKVGLAGVDWIQIREKDLEARTLLQLTRFAVAGVPGNSLRVVVNDRLDVAIAAGAAGVHLGESSLPVEAVAEWRRSAGDRNFMIGVSCHSLASARAAAKGGADYIFFGPVFATPSKASFGVPQGIEGLREICQALEIPVLAIGGVNLENARDCFEAGAAGIAAIRLFQAAKNLAETVAKLKMMK